ncbi:3-phosphoserine/phosphohydroxythreonine transaminase [Vagococcus sp. BWB3-3]|uniref:Phosphoserine aminotransferase n=1 Tax=Vagococcus allomyrinae TaxID=2794353 RepID=A0A940P7Z6_9ENTE|nr:3-phosphoserine/phosphohydroxythreonine transaminase [Vagococcus allomyrinae]MBP1043057.1 3-phosphoserine/phosphohydroxythreonine transaminase [Vagococcus allomyrinae]
MKEIYNFSAGPAVLPKSVLLKAQSELINYRDSGMSVMELSHRSSLFEEIIQEAESLLRELMAIPDNYRVLFLQGGASLQFTMVPLNLAKDQAVGYINTGTWSEKAISEAKKIPGLDVQILASSQESNYTNIPDLSTLDVPQDLAYLHLTTNNTIEGTSIYHLPKSGAVPLVADMSSNILSTDYQVADFGLIYAGAQKNIGPAGLTVVIVRDDLVGKEKVPSAMLDYAIQAKANSLYNTPPTYAIYIAKLVFEWVKELGGVKEMERRNQEKAQLLYDYLEISALFDSPVAIADRSLNNIPFVTGQPELDKQFVSEAEAAGFENLKGHRLVGGMRASLYNAFPVEGVHALIDFMTNFEQQHGGK